MKRILLLSFFFLVGPAHLLAVETVRGVIRETTEIQCATGCGTYSLDPDSTYQFTMLQGNFRLYLGQHVQITGYRDNCSGCAVFVPSEPIVVLPPLSAVEEELPSIPREVSLKQNFPNPFNPATTIEYVLPFASEIHLAVVDLLGREVALLVDAERPPGVHRERWHPRALRGGIYFCQLRVTRPGRTEFMTKKMVFVQ